VLRGGKAEQVSIQIGLSDGTVTEVLSGELKEGDEVVVEATVQSAATSTPLGGGRSRRMF
jgi:HlyD family secretion protein